MLKRVTFVVLVLCLSLMVSGCGIIENITNPLPDNYTKGVRVPRDFPDKELEIYDDAVVFEADDDDDEIAIKFGTMDEIDDIIDFYEDLFDHNDMTIEDSDDDSDEYYAKGSGDGYTFTIEVTEARSKYERRAFAYVIEAYVKLQEEIELPDDIEATAIVEPIATAEPTPVPDPTATPAPLVLTVDHLLAGQDRNIEAAVAQYTWQVNGDTVPARPNSALPAGYPREIVTELGSTTYTFNTIDKTVTHTSFSGGVQTAQMTRPYVLDSTNTYITAFQRPENREDVQRFMQSIFFVSDGVLYECEQLDGIDSTNYLAHTAIGPSDGGGVMNIEDIAAGLDRHVENTVVNRTWVITSFSAPAAPNNTMPQGYPRNHIMVAGTSAYEFDIAAKTMTQIVYTNGVETARHIESYTVGPTDTYMTAYVRSQDIGGQSRQMQSIFFVSGGVLFEGEQMDGVDCSNYIAYRAK